MSSSSLLLGFALHAALTSVVEMPSRAPDDIAATTRAFHAERQRALTAEDGWLTLVGLCWLDPGESRAGSAQSNACVFPEALPAVVGTFKREGMTVAFTPAPGVTVTRAGSPFAGGVLRSDADGSPDVLQLGSVRFYVIRRGDRFGVRVKDAEAPARKAFHDIAMYPPSAAWRIEGRFEPAAHPEKLQVRNVLGLTDEMVSPGAVVFSVGGKEYRLRPVLEDGSDQLFFIFGDETNRTETYNAGRFLYADPPKNGKVVLDFNRAINPPCAFSHFATCPLPPPGNRLALKVEAGEKRYGSH